jgi:hypothetical protein
VEDLEEADVAEPETEAVLEVAAEAAVELWSTVSVDNLNRG